MLQTMLLCAVGLACALTMQEIGSAVVDPTYCLWLWALQLPLLIQPMCWRGCTCYKQCSSVLPAWSADHAGNLTCSGGPWLRTMKLLLLI